MDPWPRSFVRPLLASGPGLTLPALVELVPEIDLTLWPNFRELVADSSA